MRGYRPGKRSVGLAIALIAAGIGGPQGTAASEAALDTGEPRTIVRFSRLPADLQERLSRAGITHAAVFPSFDAVAIAGPRSAQEAVARWVDVIGAEADTALRTYMEQAVETTRANLVRIGAKPLKSAYTGKEITVAIVDTGIDTTHPDLDEDKVAMNLDFSPSAIFDPLQSEPTNLDSWRPLISEPVDTLVGTDTAGHGTWVAGVVGGTGESALGADLRGVAPDATLVNLDLDGAGTPYIFSSSVLAAVDWLIQRRDDPRFPGGIRVAVAGIGSDCRTLICETPSIREALQRAIAAGIVIVFPTGAAVDGDVTYPARYPEMISVRAACKDQDTTSDLCQDDQGFSNVPRGPSIDLAAPGVFVWTPSPAHKKLYCQLNAGDPPCTKMWVPGEETPQHELNNRLWYQFSLSHSVAAAHVAGVAALMLEANPSLRQVDVERVLQETARDLGPFGFDDRTGYGMVDALPAVRAAEKAAKRAREKTTTQVVARGWRL